jgi:hypothetical protein
MVSVNRRNSVEGSEYLKESNLSGLFQQNILPDLSRVEIFDSRICLQSGQ